MHNHFQPKINELQQFTLQINNGYFDWEKVRYMNLPLQNISNEAVWEAAKAERDQGITRKLQLGNYAFQWSLSNSMELLLHEFDINIAGGLEAKTSIKGKQQHRYLINAQIEECIASAQIAGASISKKSTKEMLLKKRSPQNTGEQIVHNLFHAGKLIRENKDQQLTENLLLQLHQAITKDIVLPKACGRFRTNNKVDIAAFTGIKDYTLPNFGEVKELMNNIYYLFNNNNLPFFIHPLVKAAIIHYLIVYIKPFRAANDRLARLLANWYLLKNGYWLMDYMSISNMVTKLKAQYLKSFTQVAADGNDIGYFIYFDLQAIKMAHKSLKEQLEKSNVKEKKSHAFIQEGLNERQAIVLQWIKEDAEKIVTIREMRTAFGVSKETARTDLTALVEQGLLKNYSLNKKTYAFVKGDKFENINTNATGNLP